MIMQLNIENKNLLTDKEVLLMLNFRMGGKHKRIFLTTDFKKYTARKADLY
jgi:hypothetical protein